MTIERRIELMSKGLDLTPDEFIELNTTANGFVCVNNALTAIEWTGNENEPKETRDILRANAFKMEDYNEKT